MKKIIGITFLILAFTQYLSAQTISIQWKDNPGDGTIAAVNGDIQQLKITKGNGKLKKNNFKFSSSNNCGLIINVDNPNTRIGSGSTIINVKTAKGSFSFFLRDVQSNNPIYIPYYGVVVLPGDDNRNYVEIENIIVSRKNLTKIQKIERLPESSFKSVTPEIRNMNVPIWLGLSRDMRLFEVEDELEDNNLECKAIRPRFSATGVTLPESNNNGVFYRYALGRGVGVKNNITKSIENGSMPIYHSEMRDDDIKYHSITFASLEKSILTSNNVEGTDYIISDKYSPGRVFTDEQKVILEKKIAETPPYKEEVVLFSRTEIENMGSVPHYAWIKAPQTGNGNWKYNFDNTSGFSAFSEDRVFCISKLNGAPMHNEEIAILLQPGQKATFEFYLPHSPVSNQRAQELGKKSFDTKYAECKAYWNNKLARAANIEVPEKRIQEMIQAGLLHLDLITYGKEPNGTLAANVGIYSPIGTESAPIIQFYASMGWKDEAKRSIAYFLDTQQESGLIANYSGYMIETGAVLWNVGEYYRYTRDKNWIEQIKPKLLKSCEYLIDWRNKNKIEKLRGKGYGMIDGKVADPEDNYHQFMLNGYAYMGMSRMAEVMKAMKAPEAARYEKEATDWKKDIRASFFNAMTLSPVVPLGDGSWCPTVPPWPEAEGPRLLYQKPEVFWSHGTFSIADGLLGPMYLIFCEVLDPSEQASKILFDYHGELMFQENSAFSQPYYSRHNWYQTKMGMVKPFLNTYYSTMAATTDHQTYSFWEHLYKMTPHKTHEEANFLMDTRRMLYLEEGDTLSLMKVIPRQWLENGKQIKLNNVQSYFGELNVIVSSNLTKGYIDAVIDCNTDRKPSCIKIRLPHPENKKPKNVIGGDYDEKNETIIVNAFNGNTRVRLEYDL
ncbi:MAG: hypothetical protein E6767_06840 [Dysgonomonas sp.]|nr:hypothetical protein [Dysgonomonas sp.]